MALFFLIALVANEMLASAVVSALRQACRNPPQKVRQIGQLGDSAGREGEAFGHARQGKPFNQGSVAALPAI